MERKITAQETRTSSRT